MNTNLLFVILLVVTIIFISRLNIYITLTTLGIVIVYYWYIKRFTSPRDFLNSLSNKVTELFTPCSSNNPAYCEDKDSNWTFLPEIMRSGETQISSERDNDMFLKTRLAPSTQLGTLSNYTTSLSSMMNNIPLLSESKVFLDKVTNFIQSIVTDDKFQKEFIFYFSILIVY